MATSHDLDADMVLDLYCMVCKFYGLKDPPMLLVKSRINGDLFGQWDNDTGHDIITISLSKHRRFPISYLMDTILHELAHWQDSDAMGQHDDSWQKLARKLGAVPTRRGLRV